MAHTSDLERMDWMMPTPDRKKINPSNVNAHGLRPSTCCFSKMPKTPGMRPSRPKATNKVPNIFFVSIRQCFIDVKWLRLELELKRKSGANVQPWSLQSSNSSMRCAIVRAGTMPEKWPESSPFLKK